MPWPTGSRKKKVQKQPPSAGSSPWATEAVYELLGIAPTPPPSAGSSTRLRRSDLRTPPTRSVRHCRCHTRSASTLRAHGGSSFLPRSTVFFKLARRLGGGSSRMVIGMKASCKRVQELTWSGHSGWTAPCFHGDRIWIPPGTTHFGTSPQPLVQGLPACTLKNGHRNDSNSGAEVPRYLCQSSPRR